MNLLYYPDGLPASRHTYYAAQYIGARNRVMLFNADHPANQRLSLQDVNERPGRDLHRLYWLNDDEIGELPPEWNVLIGIHELPQTPKLIHYTLGTPDIVDSEHAELWLREYAELS